jgi:hypothetical protein
MNALVRLPAGITETQSYTWVLREQIIATLVPYFTGFTIFRNNQVPIQRAQLPVLGVYLLPERMTQEANNPLGNEGMISFYHTFQIGISVIIANNDPDIAEQKLDAAFWSIMNGLWPSQTLMRMFHSPNPDGVAIEGVTSGIRRMVYGSAGLNNETPIAELQYEINCTYRSDWPPLITNTLNTIAVTVIEAGFDPTQTQTVLVQYQFSQTG